MHRNMNFVYERIHLSNRNEFFFVENGNDDDYYEIQQKRPLRMKWIAFLIKKITIIIVCYKK